jgi:hypothetical protein
MGCINDWKDATRALARIHFVSNRTTSGTSKLLPSALLRKK